MGKGTHVLNNAQQGRQACSHLLAAAGWLLRLACCRRCCCAEALWFACLAWVAVRQLPGGRLETDCLAAAFCQFKLTWPGGTKIKINYGGTSARDLRHGLAASPCSAHLLAAAMFGACCCVRRWRLPAAIASLHPTTRPTHQPPKPSTHRRRLFRQPAQQRSGHEHAQRDPPARLRQPDRRHADQLLRQGHLESLELPLLRELEEPPNAAGDG